MSDNKSCGCACEVARLTAEVERERADASRLRQRVQTLEGALTRLVNESRAIEGLAEEAIKECVGNTNLRVWQRRIQEADAVLSPAPVGEGQPQAVVAARQFIALPTVDLDSKRIIRALLRAMEPISL